MSWWVPVTPVGGEPYSLNGALLIHDNRAELEFLLPNVRTVQLTGRTPEHIQQVYGRPVLLLRDHPDMASVRWPLNRKDFRR